jgi:cytochrome P450
MRPSTRLCQQPDVKRSESAICLWLYPPVHTRSWRQAVADDEVCGRLIPKGAIVWVVPWVLHRNPILWENPGRFDPARFSEERSSSRSRFAYLPFSTGPGVCIGATLAMTEALLVLTAVAQAYRLRLVCKIASNIDPTRLSRSIRCFCWKKIEFPRPIFACNRDPAQKLDSHEYMPQPLEGVAVGRDFTPSASRS